MTKLSETPAISVDYRSVTSRNFQYTYLLEFKVFFVSLTISFMILKNEQTYFKSMFDHISFFN